MEHSNKEESSQQETISFTLTKFIQTLEGLDEYRLPQRAYHIIRQAIRNLILPPGLTMLEQDMSTLLEMSRTPVREALVRLEIEGLVKLVPRKGFIIEPIEKEDLKEVYEIIETLDGLAIELSTKGITKEGLKLLKAIISDQEAALGKNDLIEWAKLDNHFHTMIVDFANNSRLSTLIDSYSDQTYRARLYTVNHRPTPHQSIVEHIAIVSCMEAGDQKAARILMETHRRRARHEILAVLEAIKNEEN